MKPGRMKSGATGTADQVLVLSPSLFMQKRLEEPLSAAGYPVHAIAGVREFLRSRRQRPFLACFLDARTDEGGQMLDSCRRGRPGERYILILERWQRSLQGTDGAPSSDVLFGCLGEQFRPEEAVLWVDRAATEARLQQGDRSLDDLLYEKFRGFLQNLGPGPMTRLYDLVWERVERPLMTAVLEWTGGNQTRAADILGVHRNTLRAKIRNLGIDASRFTNGAS